MWILINSVIIVVAILLVVVALTQKDDAKQYKYLNAALIVGFMAALSTMFEAFYALFN